MSEMACPPEALRWGDAVRLKGDERSRGLIVDRAALTDHWEVVWEDNKMMGFVYHKDELFRL